MRHLRYLPLAFLAGAHGFALLAPYMAVCAVVHAISLQRRRLVPVPITVMSMRPGEK
ncbi:MAG TPA: hypothetical protein VF624_06700 [Tepidisphaeraceae bacterium]|jgi:hypothetical protein